MKLFFCISLSFFLVFPQKIFAQVVISEFYPNPPGEDSETEWIELYNPTDDAVSLQNWKVQDVLGTIKVYTFPDKVIHSGEFVVLMRKDSGITLNNDTEQIKLISPTGAEFLSGAYTNIQEGKSFGLIEEEWKEMQPSPGGANIQPSPLPSATPNPAPTPSPVPSPSPLSSPYVSPSPASSPLPQRFLQLSEFVACGADTEWVEMYNPQSFSVSLSGWKIEDASSSQKLFPEKTLLPHAFEVLEWNGYLLNNSGDAVKLLYQNQLIDEFEFDECIKGNSWAKIGGEWIQSSEISKGGSNPSEPALSPSATPKATASPKSLSQPATPITPPIIFQEQRRSSSDFSLLAKEKSSVSPAPKPHTSTQMQTLVHSSPNHAHDTSAFLLISSSFTTSVIGFLSKKWYNFSL